MSLRDSEYCQVHNTDTNKKVDVEVLDFRPYKSLSVLVNKQVKLVMYYNKDKKIYIGNMGGMEFLSAGPTN